MFDPWYVQLELGTNSYLAAAWSTLVVGKEDDKSVNLPCLIL